MQLITRLRGMFPLLVAFFTLVPLSEAASVRVVHGIPGADVGAAFDPALPVDVRVNGPICLIQGFTFGDVAGPFTLPGGDYDIEVIVADTLNPCGGTVVIGPATVTITDTANATIVAHLDTAGGLTASPFLNDVTPTEGGQARIVAHHLANAPAVDISIRTNFGFRTPTLIEGAANGAQAGAVIDDGRAVVGITPAGGRAAIFIERFNIVSGLTHNVYAVGSLENGTFALIADRIGGIPGDTLLP